MKLDGKIAVVTGGSEGMGYAAMKALVNEGATVVAIARNSDKLKIAAESISPAYRNNVICIAVDVRLEEEVRAAISQVISALGRIDILVNCAGVSMRERQVLQKIEVAEWNRIIDTNLTGTFLMCREVLPVMVSNNSGYIINILSTGAYRCIPGNSLYSASKYGVRAITETLIEENRGTGIRATSISPGPVNTTIWNHKIKPVTEEDKSTMLKADDISNIILYLVTLPPAVHIDNITVTPWFR